MGIPFLHPKPQPPTDREYEVIPQVNAGWWKSLTFAWIAPLLKTGFGRPLEANDLWRMDDARLTKSISDQLEANFFARCPPSIRPERFAGGKRKIHSQTSWIADKKGSFDEKSRGVHSSDTVVNTPSTPDSDPADHDIEKSVVKTVPQQSDDLRRMEQEQAEQETLQDLNPELGEINLAVDMPILERSFSLALKNSNVSRPAQAKSIASTKIQGKALEDFGYLARRLPFTGYSKAVKIAEGRYVWEKNEQGQPQLYDQSLTMALFQTMKFRMMLAMCCKIVASLITQLSSLVTKQLILFITMRHAYANLTPTEKGLAPAPPSIGKGIGLAIALTCMQEIASLCNNHYFASSMGCGWQMRASLIDQISRKSLRLSPASRLEFTNGRLTTSVSGDCSFLDFASPMTIECIVEPFTILVGMALLIYYLGYSALVGIAVLLSSTPLMGVLFRGLIASRRKQMATVDLRVRLLSEILNSIRQIKLYAYESYFAQRVLSYRTQEIARLRSNVKHRAFMTSTMTLLPTMAAVLTFITYGLSGHRLDAAIIFSALQVFALIQGPLRILPMAFTALTDAHVAVVRISKCLLAEELPRELQIDENAKYAIKVEGDFTFETAGGPQRAEEKKITRGRDRKAEKEAKVALEKKIKEARERRQKGLPPIAEETKQDEETEKPFTLTGVDLTIPRGALVVVVGRIGSGKSALLQALIGEMRQTRGDVQFGGSLSYVSQQPWVMSATLKQNIVFGSNKEDYQRLAHTLSACSLTRDLEHLADGIDTEIGERGINLSGGQKARVGLARAVYFDADIVIMDDVLAAVDAHVSAHLLENCIVHPDALGKKTRVLVTHHLEVTPYADMIVVVEDGRIVQQGSYQTLKANDGIFKSMLEEHGQEDKKEATEEEKPKEKEEEEKVPEKKDGPAFKLLMDEERNTGSVAWSVYGDFFKAMGSYWYPITTLAFLCLAQCSNVSNTLFLGFWSGGTIHGFHEGDYMAIYAALGFALAVFTFLGSYNLSLSGLRASMHLFKRALNGIMRSPVLYHDSTPIGRIISRLSKDIEMIDDRLTMQVYQLFSQLLSVLGTVALVLYTYSLLGVIFIPLVIVYVVLAGFYRQSSREVKRLDSILRSNIYSSFGEQLVGLASIRAYRQQPHFRSKLQGAVDVECRAYAMSIYLQRWLGIRLDALGNLLIAGICLFGVGFADSVSPSKLGVVLTYGLTATQSFSQIINFYAQVEQEMNNVERVTHTGNLPLEAAPTLLNDPPKEWPQKGAVKFDNVQMRYREQLPLVLKGLTFEASAGEKIGIVGRTGAGKSSLAQVLFRLVELAAGTIEIDGVDLSKIGLDTLRTRLSIIPQEALLFSGSVRDNLDPTGIHSDVDLNDALSKCDLLPGPDASAAFIQRCAKFQLSSPVANEGGNFSAGERQLLALARAVAKRSRVTILDEATSSVDPETDASIQKTIRNHLTDTTLLCIAHRLHTIAFYDRILVMDAGVIAELDTPLALFDKQDSIFRSLCDAANLTREQIVKIRTRDDA